MFIEEFLPPVETNTREHAVAISILALLIMSWEQERNGSIVLAVPLLTLGQW